MVYQREGFFAQEIATDINGLKLQKKTSETQQRNQTLNTNWNLQEEM